MFVIKSQNLYASKIYFGNIFSWQTKRSYKSPHQGTFIPFQDIKFGVSDEINGLLLLTKLTIVLHDYKRILLKLGCMYSNMIQVPNLKFIVEAQVYKNKTKIHKFDFLINIATPVYMKNPWQFALMINLVATDNNFYFHVACKLKTS